jgi:hypothetical protein
MGKLIIKEESILSFFSEQKIKESQQYSGNGQPNLYYFFKDSIIVSQSELGGVNTIEFQLTDTSRGSNKKLINTYLYSVKEYDSISFELVLIDFKIDLID